MDKRRLKQYKALQKEIPKLKRDIDKLYYRLCDVPTVAGKVTRSSDEHPYIIEHMTVQMDEPVAATEIKKQIAIKESRMEQVERDKTEIEAFIVSIPDSEDRMIFEMSFIEGKRQQEIAEEFGYTKGRISQKISLILKD